MIVYKNFSQGLSWGEATANPAAHFLSWFDGNMGALEGLTRWYLKLEVKWDLNEIFETKKKIEKDDGTWVFGATFIHNWCRWCLHFS